MSRLKDYLLNEKFTELVKPELKDAFGDASTLVKKAEQKYNRGNIKVALQIIDKLESKTLKRIVEILRRHEQ